MKAKAGREATNREYSAGCSLREYSHGWLSQGVQGGNTHICIVYCISSSPTLTYTQTYTLHTVILLKVHKNENFLAPILNFVLFHLILLSSD